MGRGSVSELRSTSCYNNTTLCYVLSMILNTMNILIACNKDISANTEKNSQKKEKGK